MAASILESGSTEAWYVAYTQARQENVAATNLQHQNFQTYLPLFKTLKKPGKGAATAPTLTRKEESQSNSDCAVQLVTYEPMFPRYVFFRPSNGKQSIATVRSTRGVHSVLTFGADLAIIQHEILQAIHEREKLRDQAELEAISPFQPGSRIRLRDPALNRLEGLVQSVSVKRIALLLEILGRQKTVQVRPSQVELI
ncbi:MAG TPA: transcription termination/antitermination NusG family protein [Eoetvoesiella sp.]